ncbi:DUF2752 domain-containing protein [Isosphaeraceae bacterium EP7]
MSHPTCDSHLLGGWCRGALAAAALGLIAVLAVARLVEPDPRGYGTHERLGLSPCAFLTLTGKPCPSCGMTTSFAWFARGRLDRAFSANAAGVLLAPTCLVIVPWLLASALRGRPWGTRTVAEPLVRLVVAIAAISLLAWTIRILRTT